MWTGEFEMNTLHVDRETFESGEKKMRIQKYTDTCGRGLNVNYLKVILIIHSKLLFYAKSLC